jgi:hypothetical protein
MDYCVVNLEKNYAEKSVPCTKKVHPMLNKGCNEFYYYWRLLSLTPAILFIYLFIYRD